MFTYMFSYGPFSHTGLKLDYAINDDWSLIGVIMNDSDYTTFNLCVIFQSAFA